MIYELICHGVTARTLDQVRDYLNGDAHDQTKVAMYNGDDTLHAIDCPTGNYPVCAMSGEMGSLLITEDDDGTRSFSLTN